MGVIETIQQQAREESRRIWGFPGGLHLDDHKLDAPIQVLPAPAQVVLPIAQHIGQPAKPIVEVGQRVLRGEVVAEASGYVSTPIHATISGTISAIEPRPVAHPSGLDALCVVIDSDGQDAAAESLPATKNWKELDAETLRDRVRDAGVVGLGGAAFPSFIKLNTGERPVNTLVLNGAECEPYISADMNLMAQRPGDIIRGAALIMHAIGARDCLIGVEDNTPGAIDALRREIADQDAANIHVVVVPTRYPQGGEKQLIQALTGKEIPSAGLPLDIGIVCHNVATAAAVWRAVTIGEPLTSRIVSVTGTGVAKPGVFEVRFGTPVADVLTAAGGTAPDATHAIMGGPMMGFSLQSHAVPVVKATNNLLVLTRDDLRPDEPARACIRCGACADACPASLLPQQLYWHSKAGELDRAQNYNLFDCIECGVCAQVCPSHIPLVQYYRHAKTEIWAEEREKRAADIARERHEARQARLERQDAEKKAAREAKKAALREKKAASNAAREADMAGSTDVAPQAMPAKPGSPAVDDILARAKAKAAAMKKPPVTDQADTITTPTATGKASTSDPAAVAAAAKEKARAKAEAASAPDAASKAAAKAKALAKAKAGKRAKSDSPSTQEAGDAAAKAAAKAKALAKAKAAIAAKQTRAEPETTAEDQPDQILPKRSARSLREPLQKEGAHDQTPAPAQASPPLEKARAAGAHSAQGGFSPAASAETGKKPSAAELIARAKAKAAARKTDEAPD